MPITSSAKKALRSSKRKRQFNLQRKQAISGAVKKIKKLVSEKKIEEARAILPQAYKAIDKAVKTKFLKKNTASRKKARLVRLINKSPK